MALTFSFPYVDTPAFFTGSSTSVLVPDVFPVAINGRPYLIDKKSGQFTRGFEQRVRDSVDQSTAPGEAAINPGGLWRRGEVSWHLGAGQKYADTAEAQDYRFFTSKGVNPWVKGQLTLLNATKRTLTSTNTNLFMCTVKSSGGTEYVYVADGNTLKFATVTGANNVFTDTASWTSVTTGAPASAAITGLETNGVNVFVAYTNNDIYYTTPGSSSVTMFYPTTGTTGQTYSGFGYAKGWGIASVDNKLYVIGVGSGGHNVHYTSPDTTMRFVGAAGGQNAVYVGAYAGEHGLIYKMTLKADATGLDQPIVALELPLGEVPTSIYGYLGSILIGTNKGVRYCTTDSNNNLIAGSLIPTPGAVYDFTATDRFVWFGWSNFDSVSTGIGRLDLSTFISANTPAHASDLMFGDSTTSRSGDVKSLTSVAGKRLFSVSGLGVVVEDSDNLVASGSITTGIYRWGIPDRKFIASVDTRAHPLVGAIRTEIALDESDYVVLGNWDADNTVENSLSGDSDKAIEAKFRFTLSRDTATTGPTFTRWTARAYAAPFRSEFFRMPVLIHETLRVFDNDYFFNVEEELGKLRELINDPRICTLQIGTETVSVIVEDMEWTPVDNPDRDWIWEGTATVTMRSVQE